MAHTTHNTAYTGVIIVHINDYKLRSALLHSLVNTIRLSVM